MGRERDEMMKYPVKIQNLHGSRKIIHPQTADSMELTIDLPWGICWSDGSITACQDLEQFWETYVAQGAIFENLVRKLVRDELAQIGREAGGVMRGT